MATLHSPPELSATTHNLKRWTVKDYHRLSELGLLDPGERTELIAGQIIIMAAKGIPHVTALRAIALKIDEFLRDRPFFAITQDPIQLDDLSEPEPDLIIAKGNFLTYTSKHPQPDDIRLIVEVADSTIQHDCQIKDKAYARSKIEEYWVIDLPNQQLHVFQSPTQQGYGVHQILPRSSQVSPLAFPEMLLLLEDIFSPIG